MKDRKDETPKRDREADRERRSLSRGSERSGKSVRSRKVEEKVGDKWRLNDLQVKTLIEQKYNPERTIIREETENIDPTPPATPKLNDVNIDASLNDFDSRKEEKEIKSENTANATLSEYTMVDYTVLGGGKKKKKKKKVKRKVTVESEQLP